MAFARALFWNGVYELCMAAFPGGEPRRLTHDNKTVNSPIWTPDGREIIFRSNRLGSWNLWRIAADAARGTEPSLIPDTEGAGSADISKGPPPRLVFARQIIDRNIWVAERQSDGSSYGPARPLLHSTRNDGGGQFSPDGRRISYVSNQAGEEGFWLAGSDGSNPIQITGGRMMGAHDWSPDGTKIAFDYLQDLYVLDSKGGAPRAVLTGPASDQRPRWSRDGEWIYFRSDRSGSRQIWKMRASGENPFQLTKGGGVEGWESLDGKLLYYARSWEEPGLWTVPIGGGEEKPVLDTVWHGWFAMADAGIYFIDFVSSKPPMLRFFDFSTGEVRGLLVVEKAARDTFQSVTVPRDGRLIAWHQTDRNEMDLMQIENFR